METNSISQMGLQRHRSILVAQLAKLRKKLRACTEFFAQREHVAENTESAAQLSADLSPMIDEINYGQVQLIEAALIRIENGEYGFCVKCKKRISPKRLKAIPWASHCITCENRTNRRGVRRLFVERFA